MTPHTTTTEVDSADELLAIAKTIPDRHVQTALTNVRAHLAVLRGRVERAQQRQREKARLDAERAEAKRRAEQLQSAAGRHPRPAAPARSRRRTPQHLRPVRRPRLGPPARLLRRRPWPYPHPGPGGV